LRKYSNQKEDAAKTHHDHKMDQEIEKENDIVIQFRHDKYVELMKILIDIKKEEKQKIIQDKAKIDDDFDKYKEYQDRLSETRTLNQEIEEAFVRGQFLEIQVENLKEVCRALNDKKENLIEDKKQSQAKNEEARNTRKSQIDTAKKRLQNKLQRDKNATVRELIANLELAQEHNKEISQKLTTESENYDKLLREKMYAEEILALKNAELEVDTKVVE